MQEPERRFRVLYTDHSPAVLAYALRRVAAAEDAADVVAETFLIVWRRLHDVPDGGEARLWLYGVARHVLANHHRAGGRRDRLSERLRHELGQVYAVPDPAVDVVGADAVRWAMARLPELDREVLTLSFLEELAPREIAAVLGLDPVVVRARLTRARTRLRAELAAGTHVPGLRGHEQGVASLPAGKESR